MSIVFKGDNFSVRVFSREVREVNQQFEVVERPRTALCIPILHGGKLVFINQFRPAINKDILEFPAGRIEEWENSEHAVRRELQEEIGFKIESINFLGTLLTAPHFSDEVLEVFAGKGEIVSAPAPTPKEDIRDIVTIMSSSINKSIAEGHLIDSKSIAALTLARVHGPQFGVSL